MNLCRICLEESFELKDLFEKSTLLSYYDKLTTCVTSITGSEMDERPKGICSRCVQSLEQAYDFHMLVIKSDAQLHRLERKRLKIKVEKYDLEDQVMEIKPDLSGYGIDSPLNDNGKRKRNAQQVDDNHDEKPTRARKNAALRDANGKYIRRKKQIRVSNVKCDICEKKFWTRAHVLRHMPIHTGERPFVCETCGKSFKFLTSLNRHTEAHNGNRPKLLKCHICSFKAAYPHDYKSHLVTHSDETPFSCDVCGKKFNRKGNLVAHVRYIHSEPSVTCEFCQEKFRTQGGLRKHIVRHYRSIQYECAECKNVFSLHKSLVKHVKNIHSGVKWPSKNESRVLNTKYT